MPIQIDLGSSSPSSQKKVTPKGPVVGIDLGTTNSLVAKVGAGNVAKVLRSPEGDALVPSCVKLDREGRVVSVGESARAERGERNEHGEVIYSAKRLMGRTLKDLGNEAHLIPFELVDDEVSNQVRIRTQSGKVVSPIEISSEILKELARRAQAAIGEAPARAVITVPAYFDDAQRTATKAAGKLAGLDVIRILNEPTAAALAYGWSNERPGVVAVFDLGGGTFDVSVLRIQENLYEVLSTGGDTRLGGDDFDQRLAEFALARLIETTDLPKPQNESERRALVARLVNEAEQVKRTLSDSDSAEFMIDGRKTLVTKGDAETLWAPLVQQALQIAQHALIDAKLKVTDVSDVLLVGGSTRMPLVRRMVSEFFGREANTSLNPDEAVALGAAIQAEALAGSGSEHLLLDVIPLSLGLETMGGAVTKLIHRNSQIPTEAREVFTNHAEHQTAFDIHVVQGERELVKDNRSLAKFKLRGLPPAPAGFHRMEVLFRIDANGILNVRATDLRSKKSHEIEVRPSFGLNDDELMTMLETSFDNAEDDMAARQLVDARVEADTVIRAADKAIANAGKLISGKDLALVKARLVDLRNSVQGSSSAKIHEALTELNNVSLELAELQVNAALQKALSGQSAKK